MPILGIRISYKKPGPDASLHRRSGRADGTRERNCFGRQGHMRSHIYLLVAIMPSEDCLRRGRSQEMRAFLSS
jgi:homoaconitase/3-isopropylmalate dehydratase large subunit